jgi:hypothetical protein
VKGYEDENIKLVKKQKELEAKLINPESRINISNNLSDKLPSIKSDHNQGTAENETIKSLEILVRGVN